MLENNKAEGHSRLHYLDVLRGIASVIVACFFHYQHFSSNFQPNSIGNIPPFYFLPVVRFFFDLGDVMVDLFFVLSGIVFSYTYQKKIKSSKVNGFGFFIKRFSRLYPIHFLTLCISTLIIVLFTLRYDSLLLYENNNIFHFILNVLNLQNGFFDKGYSFNGPSWSLSIEMFMYFIFFFQAKYLKPIYSSIFFIITGVIFFYSPVKINFLVNYNIARGLIGFFCGCLMNEILLKDWRNTYLKIAPLFLGICYLFYLLWISNFKKIPINFQVIVVLFVIIPYIHHNDFIRKKFQLRFLILLGDISLSVYLIHVPIQFGILLFYRATNKVINYNDPLFFLSYCFIVLFMGYFLHYYYEKPAQEKIRKVFYKRMN